ncbi:MAG: polysaccharide biosynthesis protein [Clostridia bacterium]|nr:polysaccharide biosynthesis protein [Clostridia bacterium]
MRRINWKDMFTKQVIMAIYDIVAINLSYIVAQFSIHVMYEEASLETWAAIFAQRFIPVTIVFFMLLHAFRVYASMWEYAGIRELVNVCSAISIGGLASVAIDIAMAKFGFAMSEINRGCLSIYVYVTGTVIAIALVGGMRLAYRLIRRYLWSRKLQKQKKIDRVMIVGAGDMGMIIISELGAGNYSRGKPVVAVDDNPAKIGKRLRGVPVKGSCSDIPELAERYKVDTIILCLPSAAAERQTEIMRLAVETGCKLKTSPSILEMSEGVEVNRIRDVNISDLLARPEVKLDPKVCNYITGQTVLVTGGGGSIGSELCRQISKYNPEKIIVFDIYENNAYMLKHQLDSSNNGNSEIHIRIGSIRDINRLHEVFEEFRPTVIFHAAAHKHVPLMEDSPKEAVKNNIFGTYNVAKTAIEFGVKRFVSISTDKAVNPANVMGATKRVTEMVVQYFQRKCGGSTVFAAVRFGNVLGSSGSVIPIFTEQIKEGGPVTVTHPDITRYFMTIPEASQLVAQAGGLANGGEVFVLDMGEPVKILSLAENLIRLSGYKPYSEIDIKFSGLRPGEKLYEELVLEEESNERRMTANNKIFVTKPLEMDDDAFEKKLEELRVAEESDIRRILKEIVPNYVEQQAHGIVH